MRFYGMGQVILGLILTFLLYGWGIIEWSGAGGDGGFMYRAGEIPEPATTLLIVTGGIILLGKKKKTGKPS